MKSIETSYSNTLITILLITLTIPLSGYRIVEDYEIKGAEIGYDKASKLNSKKDKTASDILEIYRVEEKIGAAVLSLLLNPEGLDFYKKHMSHIQDTDVLFKFIGYLKAHPDRFTEVSDCWKGEDNNHTASRYWLNRIKEKYPKSKERWEIEWDIVYKELRNCVTFDKKSVGKTCKQFYAQSDDEWISGCEAERENFRNKLDELLKFYSGTPIEKKLKKIDFTTVVYDPGC